MWNVKKSFSLRCYGKTHASTHKMTISLWNKYMGEMLCKEGKVFFSLPSFLFLPHGLGKTFFVCFLFQKRLFPTTWRGKAEKVSQHGISSRPTTTQRFISCRWMSIIYQSGNRDALENDRFTLMVVFLSLAVEFVFFIHEKCESSVAKAWEGRKKPCASFVQQTRHKTQDMCVRYQRWNETRRHFFCVQLKLCSFVVSSLTHVSFQIYLIILTAWKKVNCCDSPTRNENQFSRLRASLFSPA